MKELNLFLEFQKSSGDFLKALGEMSMKVDNAGGRPIMFQTKDLRDVVSTVELFWDVTEKIFLKYEEKLVELRLLSTVEHAKAILLRSELRETYNEMYKVSDKIPETILKLMKNTKLPSKEELNEDVILKNKPAANG